MSQHKARLLIAFAAVYLIWGSTYLGIRWAIETMPTFLMAGTRFLVAGAILYVWGRLRGGPKPTLANWRDATVIGTLLLLGGNGLVVWAEQYVPSGLTALMVATEPLWVVMLDWLRPHGTRPTKGEAFGLALGFGGVVLLIGPTNVGGAHVDPLSAGVLVLATLAWASGSLYSRGAKLPRSPLLTTGMNMLAGGAILTLVGTAMGQWGAVHPSAISLRSALSLLYLIVFGAIVAFTAYLWILKEAALATASTYAYVNPVVAVFLGWALAGEAITPRVVAAASVIVGSVVIITLARTAAFRNAGALVRRAASWPLARRRAA
jgi:drug/metabolite transporter (DMT)-like permease